MKLFLRRLGITLGFIVVALFIGGAFYPPFAIAYGVVIVIVGCAALLYMLYKLAAYLVVSIRTFIHWLFIEPFRSTSGNQRKGGDRT